MTFGLVETEGSAAKLLPLRDRSKSLDELSRWFPDRCDLVCAPGKHRSGPALEKVSFGKRIAARRAKATNTDLAVSASISPAMAALHARLAATCAALLVVGRISASN
jgi:hypothetical protein